MRLPARPLGVQARITVTACAALLAALVLAAMALVWAVRDTVEQTLDDRIRARAESVAALARDVSTTDLRRSLDDPAAQSVLVQIVDERSGRVVAASPELRSGPRLTTMVPVGADALVQRVELSGVGWEEGDARVAVVRASSPRGPVLVYAATAQEAAEQSVQTAQSAALIGVPVVLLAFASAIWFVVGRTLRPVERIRAQVAGITASNLAARVPEPRGNDEITRLALTMNGMLDRLQQSADRQTRFVADVSHELHSPLASTRAELEVARAHPDSTDLDTLTDELLADNTRMTKIVSDLLFLARAGSPAAHGQHEPVDLDDVVLTEVRRLTEHSSVAVSTVGVGQADVFGDPDALARVVRNLVENAQRHATSSVVVALAGQVGRVRLTVADDGPGVPAADRERIFERFTRLDGSRSRTTGGAGLGLAIAREIVAGHGGTLAVEQAAGGGACFVVDLPAV